MLSLLIVTLVMAQQPSPSAPTQGVAPTPPVQSVAPAPPAASKPALTADDLPVSIDRIERALSQKPAITVAEQHPVFRVEVFGKKPSIEDILGPKFWMGPAPYGGMTHREFMDMVTPKQGQPFAGSSSGQLAQLVAYSLAEQWALRTAIQKFHDAREEQARAAARQEVLDALAALEKARREAGLPAK